MLGEALEAARQIEDRDDRATALAAIAPHLAEPLRERMLGEALEAARQTSYEYARVEALAALAPHLAEPLREEVLGEALEAARQISDEYARARALAALAPRLAEVQPVTLYAEWQKTLRNLANLSRHNGLFVLKAYAPILAKLGGAQAVAGTLRSIQDVGRWWP
jgi:hypothetical protein